MTAALWRQIQKGNFTRLEPLMDFLELSPSLREELLSQPRFALNVPRRLAEKMAKNCLEDPIFRQFVPLQEEALYREGFSLDPVQDQLFCQTGKLLHKYQGRALLLATGACAMHCRFCFRQNFPYEPAQSGFEKELEWIARDESLSELILSGGDPLSLSNRSLAALFHSLETLSHVRRIRFHTRFPIGIPERIDAGLLELFASSSKQLFFVLHCNHPRELDPDILAALKKISLLGIPLLNQAVLLRGVNDELETQLSLCETLINGGILPYYLHLLDPVQGTSHFAVSEERGRELIEQLKREISGFGVPRLSREEPGKPSKSFLT